MNLSLSVSRTLGATALILGVVLLAFAYNASNAPMDQAADAFTGRSADQAIWYLLLGIAAAVTGGVLVLSGKQAS